MKRDRLNHNTKLALILAALTLTFTTACRNDSSESYAQAARELPVSRSTETYNEPEESWVAGLEEQIQQIRSEAPGEIGIYVRHLGSGHTVSLNADRLWYQASTIKIPVAIAVLQLVEEGALSLDDRLTLQETDFVDGAGSLLWTDPGTEMSLRQLLEMMLVNSDSTATDMLIRLIGVEELNRRITEKMSPEGFEPFTTIIQVRYDAYSEIHPDVMNLSNMDLVELRSFPAGEPRFKALTENLLGLGPDDLEVLTISEAFNRYYSRNLNSVTLEAYGELLERLNNGELLTEEHTALMISMMESIETGTRRIQAGLPSDVAFAQKTGTQLERACNVGIIQALSSNAVVVAVCTENFGEIANAEQTFQAVGSALASSGVLAAAGR